MESEILSPLEILEILRKASAYIERNGKFILVDEDGKDAAYINRGGRFWRRMTNGPS